LTCGLKNPSISSFSAKGPLQEFDVSISALDNANKFPHYKTELMPELRNKWYKTQAHLRNSTSHRSL